MQLPLPEEPMKKKIFSYLQFATAIVLVSLVGIVYTHAQDQMKADDMKAPAKQVIKAPAQSSRGGGADPNIKSEAKPANDPNVKTPPPPEKSGQRGARGCAVEVSNYTAWFVNIYSNGVYVGTVGPWANGVTYPPMVGSAVYARANFTDGSWKYWGPRQFVCAQGGIYSWELTP
jgi:hypothetical protein